MKSLKKKFGKFAVSTEKMAKVNGGIDDDDTIQITVQCWDKQGKPYGGPVLLHIAEVMAQNGFVDGCSN